MRILTKRKDGVIISTVRPMCLAWYGEYETAVSINGEPWRILEGYETETDATQGHNKYEKMSKQELLEFDYIG